MEPHPTQPAKSANVGLAFAGVLVLALILFGLGVYLVAQQKGWTVLAAGSLAVIGTLLGWAIAAASSTRSVDRSLEVRLAPVLDRFDRITAQLKVMTEQQLISDRAKQIAFRQKDRDAFRRAIEEDLAQQEYDAAVALVGEMEREFGRRGEIERLKADVIGRRDEAVRRQLDGALAVVERHVEAEQWHAAFKEAERLKGVFPDQVRIETLASDIEARRQNVKQTLLARWAEHVKAHEIDQAIVVLRKLDNYLTPVEAGALEEDARMIFREKLARLRTEFTAAVQAHNWREAKRLADVVINEYPNTQMAREVRDMMPTLEERLREPAAAMAT